MIALNFHSVYQNKHSSFELNIQLSLDAGKFYCLYGPSGAGKTCLLRNIVGLETPKKGSIIYDEEVWFDGPTFLKPQERNCALVFQEYALFPHMTAEQNIHFAGEDKDLNQLLLSKFELTELASKLPSELSGGQQQRVALARAIAQRPKLLLLDEPLSALDPKMRFHLQEELTSLHKELGLTTIMVSHDLSEVHRLSDEVILLENGRVTQKNTPEKAFQAQEISGKFKFSGEIVKIEREDVVFIVTVLIQNQLVRVVATNDEVANLRPGDHVLIASKAFNPVILKTST